MLVVPPRSLQLKSALTYDDWALIKNGLITFRMFALKRQHTQEATDALDLEKDVQKILEALLKEANV